MDRFFHPKSVVLYGVSANASKGGHHVFLNVKDYMTYNHYPDLYIIHPKETQIDGIKCYPRWDAMPISHNNPPRIDLAIIVLPVNAVMEAARECIRHKVRGIIIASGNLTENEKEEKMLGQELKDLIKNTDTRIMGPNSIGVTVPNLHFTTHIKHYTKYLQTRETNVGILSQSGLFLSGFVEFFYEGAYEGQPFGIWKIAAIGNKLDVNECDILEDYLQDPHIHVIGMYLEDFRDGSRFKTLLQSNIEKFHKPIVLLKAGKSERAKKAIVSHTGSLAGSYITVEALAKQYRLMLVDSYEELFGLLNLISHYPKIRGNRVGVISISGSGCVLSADFAEKHGIVLPELLPAVVRKLRPLFPDWAPIKNPIDSWVSIEKMGPRSSFNGIAKIFFETGQFDAIILITLATNWAPFDYEFLQEMQKNYPDTLVILHFFGGEALLNQIETINKRNLVYIGNLDFIFHFLGKLSRYSNSR